MPGENEYSDDFATDIASEIGSELFAKTEPAVATAETGDLLDNVETAPVAKAPVAKEPPAPTTPAEPATIVPGVNSVLKPLPKSWKKDMAPLWEKADPALHEYVYAREAEQKRG